MLFPFVSFGFCGFVLFIAHKFFLICRILKNRVNTKNRKIKKKFFCLSGLISQRLEAILQFFPFFQFWHRFSYD